MLVTAGGQQAFKPPGAALRHGERRPLVEARVVQQVGSGGVSGCLGSHFDCSVLRYFGAASELAHFAVATEGLTIFAGSTARLNVASSTYPSCNAASLSVRSCSMA